MKINITIQDNFNALTWNDYTTLKLSKYPHHNLYFNSNTKELNGYLVAPGREIINVAFSSSSSNNFVRVPLVQTDEYDVLISASNINDEDVYMISSGGESDITKMDGFTDVTANEPDNNESFATRLALFEGEAVGYVQRGDIDFYKIVDIPFSSKLIVNEYYVDFNISVPMATDLNISTITTDTIKVSNTVGTTSYNLATNSLLFTPSQNFIAGTYTVTLDKNLQSATGYKLDNDISFDIDVKDYPSTAQIIYSANDSSANVQDISISGNFVYVADSWSGLQILDISSPITPILRGTYKGRTHSTTISGEYAYLYDVESDSKMQIVDISNSSSPILKSTFITSGGELNIAVAGDYAYLADRWAGLQILDISNPSLPILKSTLFASNGMNIELFGNYAYIASNESGLKIIDISNPSSPVLKHTLGQIGHIAISGNYAYGVDFEQVFKIYDISNPISPSLKGSVDISNHIIDMAISRNHAYLVGDFGLKIIDVSNPNIPIVKETIDTVGGAWDIAVSGNFAYIANPFDNGLQIVNIQMYK